MEEKRIEKKKKQIKELRILYQIAEKEFWKNQAVIDRIKAYSLVEDFLAQMPTNASDEVEIQNLKWFLELLFKD